MAVPADHGPQPQFSCKSSFSRALQHVRVRPYRAVDPHKRPDNVYASLACNLPISLHKGVSALHESLPSLNQMYFRYRHRRTASLQNLKIVVTVVHSFV